jgi:hypothetical protein
MGVRGWRKIARDRGIWELILKEVRGIHGTYRNWRKNTSVKGELESCRNKRSCFVLVSFPKD